jgi:hypothetical protein
MIIGKMMAVIVMIPVTIMAVMMLEMRKAVTERAMAESAVMTAATCHRVGCRHGHADDCDSGKEFAYHHNALM